MPLNDKSVLFVSYISRLEMTDRNVLIETIAWILIRSMRFCFVFLLPITGREQQRH